MEVHQHTHGHGKKNWKSYLWEFLMLFLAVFCGFLAEYQLEHIIEKDREVTYIQNLREDLKRDTTNINKMVTGNRILLKGIDTLLDMLSKPESNSGYQRTLYIYGVKYTYYYESIQFSELTFSQLKYSGSFRLIRDHDVAMGILQYEQGIDACKENYELLLNYFHVYESSGKELFNSSLSRRAYKAIEANFNTVYLPVSEFGKLIDEGKYIDKEDPVLYAKYFDDILYYQTTLSNVTNIVAKQKVAADSLLKLINTKYHIRE